MQYNHFHDLKLSQLGMGNMRLPTLAERGPIDEARAREIIEYVYSQGVNYFDTAYRYHNGESEPLVGQVLSQYPRETWHLATKMPGHQMRLVDGKLEFTGYFGENATPMTPREIFEDQLARCRVEYFDFYLLHNVSETSFDLYANADLGIVPYLREEQRAGRIRYLGFSSHGRPETLRRFLDEQGPFDFVQIQLNYLDWTLQNARAQYEILTERGIPVVVMEPIRGGRLATLGAEATSWLANARPQDSVASWAFRWVRSLPNVLVTLSGMTTMEHARENVRTFAEPAPMSDEERALLERVAATLVDQVPCTGCGYCLEECPQGLDIPRLISLYNEMQFEISPTVHFAIAALAEEQMPSNCIACGACARACPQGIDIPDVMERLAGRIEQIKAEGPFGRR